MPSFETLRQVREQLDSARAKREETIDFIRNAVGCSRYEATAFMMIAISENWPPEIMDEKLLALEHSVIKR